MNVRHLHFGLKIFIFLFALAMIVLLGGRTRLHAQGGAPALGIAAPKKVNLGQPIKITMRLKQANNVAGFEMNVRYDPTAAHFNELRDRNNGLKKIGREVVPLQYVQDDGGVAIGLASCNLSDCVQGKGQKQDKGVSGKALLATLYVGTDKPGMLEIRFDNAKFVDAAGNPVNVKLGKQNITVQVEQNGAALPAPASPWQLSNNAGHAPVAGAMDRTHDNQISFSDVMEFAFAWTDTRANNSPCGNLPDASLDLNGDGCIDVADVQMAASNAGPAKAGSNANTAPLTFVVNTTNDAADTTPGDGVCNATGGCTLRAAIDESNAHPGPDTITFNIPGSGVQTINLKTNLPTLGDTSGPTTIDAYTQPGASPNTDPLASNAHILIQLNGGGPNAFDAFRISSPGNTVRGFAIYNMRRGFYIFGSGATNNNIVGNFIGTDAAAQFQATATNTNGNGVDIESGASSNIVGTPALADRNVISGNPRNGIGLYFEATNKNVFQNNIISLSPLGDRRLRNIAHGIDINAAASYNIIGGTGANERNIISGVGEPAFDNFFAGIEISHGTGTVGNKALGNCIGTDLACNTAPSYAYLIHYGIRMEDGVNNNEAAYNIIGNSHDGGVQFDGYYATFNKLHDNRIGISANGTAIPNTNFGVRAKYHAQHEMIGPNNIITNSGTGVIIEYLDEDYNTITQNSIYGNSAFGIDLGPSSGVSYNDAGDTDTGSNQGLNYPVLNSATQYAVKGTACGDSVVPKPCTIEIYIAQPNPSDLGAGQYGQGKTLVGVGTASGSFTINISGVNVGDWVTATATDAQGNTSEYSKNIQVATVSGPTPTSLPPTPTPSPTPSGSQTVAQDSFSRTDANGWAVADIGNAYTVRGGSTSDFNVNGAEGTMRSTAANTTHSAFLLQVTPQDTDEKVRFKADKTPAGGSNIVYLISRHTDTFTNYLSRVRLDPGGNMYVQAVAEVNNAQTVLGGERQVAGTFAANTFYWIRTQVTGTNPTTIKIKVWQDGQSEPSAWLYTVTDSTAELQAPGAVGMRTYFPTNATNAPVVFSFDDYLAVATGPSPTPTAIPPTLTPTVVPPTPTPGPTSTPTPAGSTTYANDTFSRVVTNGWGGADTGGVYSLSSTPGNFDVNGSEGTILLNNPNTTRSAYLLAVNAQNVDTKVRVKLDKVAQGGAPIAYFIARHVASSSHYLGRIRFVTDGTLRVQAVAEVNGTQTVLGGEKAISGVTQSPNTYYWLRGQVTGTNPTTIKLKLWVDGQPEPSTWLYSVTDSTPALQASGAVGLRAYIATTATNTPILFTFDGYSVVSP